MDNIVSKALSNIRQKASEIQNKTVEYFTPKTGTFAQQGRAFMQKPINLPVPKAIYNPLQSVDRFVMQDIPQTLSLIPKTQVGQDIGSFAKYRVIEPIQNIPSNLQTIAQETQKFMTPNPITGTPEIDLGKVWNIKQSAPAIGKTAIAGMSIAGALIPGIEDLAFAGYDALKAKLAGKSVSKGFTGEEFTPLGELFKGTPGIVQKGITLAEIPLIIGLGSLKSKKEILEADYYKRLAPLADEAKRFNNADELITEIKNVSKLPDVNVNPIIKDIDSLARKVADNDKTVVKLTKEAIKTGDKTLDVQARTIWGNIYQNYIESLVNYSKKDPAQQIKSIQEVIPAAYKQGTKILVGRKYQPTIEGVTGVGRRAPQEINVSNLKLTDQEKRVIQQVSANEIKTKLTNKQIVELAKEVGIDQKTHTIDQTAKIIAEQFNFRRQIVEQEKKAKAMVKANATTDEVAKQLLKIANTSAGSTAQGTDIARQLQARRIMANEIDTPMVKVFRLLDTAGVNREAYTKLAAEMKVNFDDAAQVVDFYRRLVPPKWTDWLDVVRYNSMLSSPNTWINNFMSNLVGTGVIAPIEKEVTALVDAIYSGITGNQRQYFTGEGIQMAKGYWGDLKKSISAALEVFRNPTGKMESITDLKYAPLATTGKEAEIYKKLTFPQNILQATDELFTQMTTRGVLRSLDFKVKKGGKINIPLEDYAMQEAKKRLFRAELGQNEGSKILDGIDWLGKKIQEAKNNKNEIVSTIGKYSFPFVQTPTNLFKQGLEYSPLGVTTLWGSQHKREQVAKAIMGTAVGTSIGLLVANDRITWAEPTSEKQRNAFRAAGMQPYAIKVGDEWVSYAKLHPALAFPIALAASIKYATDNKRITDSEADTLIKGLAKWVNFFVDMSMVKTMGDLVSGIKGSAEDMSKIPVNYLTQMIPYRGFMSWIQRLIDPYQRQANQDAGFLDKQFQQISAQLPLFSYYVPARLDTLGQPIENQNRIYNAFSPFGRITTEKPAEKEIFNMLQEKARLERDKADMKKLLKSQTGEQVTMPTVSAAEETATIPTPTPSTGITQPQTGITTTTLTPDQQDIVKYKVELNKPVTDSELQATYLSQVPTAKDTRYEKAIRDSALFSAYSSIMGNEKMGESYKTTLKGIIANELGLTSDELSYYDVAKRTDNEKMAYVMDKLDSATSYQDIIDTLTSMRDEINGKAIASSGVLDNLVDDGIISKSTATYLKSITYSRKTGKKTSKSKTKKLKKVAIKSAPKAKLVKLKPIKAPKIKTVKTEKIEIPTPKFSFRTAKLKPRKV